MGEDLILPVPKELGGDLGDNPDLMGPRNVGNSPELFPSLEIGSYIFLHQLASAAILLEERLGLKLLPDREDGLKSDEERSMYIPASISRVVSLLERLTLVKPEDDRELTSRSLAEGLLPRDYVLFRVEKSQRRSSGEKSNQAFFNELRLFLLPSSKSARENAEVELVFTPHTIRRMYGEGRRGKRRLRYLDDLTQDDARDILSNRGMPPDKILKIIETYEETLPSLKISNCNASLEFVFKNGLAECSLSVLGTNYKVSEGGDELAEEEYVQGVSFNIPLTKLRFSNKETNLCDQGVVDSWLNCVACDLEKKAAVSKLIR